MREIRQPAALRGAVALLGLIENRNEARKLLDEINGARDEANAAIATYGKAKDIDKLRAKAATDLQEAEATLAAAKADADAIVGKAGKDAAKEKARQDRADRILRGAKDMELELNAREKTIAARENELQAHMDEAAAVHKEATKLKAKADKLVEEADKRRAKFDRFADEIRQ